MQFFIWVLFISFVSFLFALFQFSREDYIFLRKNVSLETLFNIACITFAGSVYAARGFYVWEHPSMSYFNPLVFLLFPYFPGLSLGGGLIGGAVLLYFFTRNKKMPTERVCDIFSLSFLCSLPVGMISFLFLELLVKRHFFLSIAISSVMFILLSIVSSLWFLKGKLKDGVATFLVYCSVSFLFICESLVTSGGKIAIKEVGTLCVIMLVSIIYVVRQQKIIALFKKRFIKK